MSALQLPNDVVAIDTGKKSLMFYVAPDKGVNKLSYLESPDETGAGNYKVKRISSAKFFKDDESEWRDIKISANNKQVAAITWTPENGAVQVRVYYVNDKDRLQEVCKTNDGDWYFGALGQNTIQVRPSTSISASVHAYGPNKHNLRVFAAQDQKFNDDDLPQISVYKFVSDESGKQRWGDEYISDKINRY